MGSTRMSPADAAWLHMDRPRNPMVVNTVLWFDGDADWGALGDTFSARVVARFEVFRARAADPPLTLGLVGPRWQPVDVQPSDHIRRVTLAGDGDAEDLRQYIASEAARPLDAGVPLWQLHLIEGFGDGGAILLRTHHALGDGPALMHVLESWSDLAAPAPSRSAARTTEGFGGLSVLGAASDGSMLSKLLAGVPSKASILGDDMGGTKAVSWSSEVPLADLKRAGKVHDATINDVGLALVAGALRRSVDEAPTASDVQASVPVTTREPGARLDGQLGNQFGLVFATLPTAVADVGARIAAVKTDMDRIKSTREARTVADALAIAGTVPKAAAQSWVDTFARRASVVVTNINGPRQRLVLGSHTISGMVLFVPTTGPVGVGLSLCSYAGSVRLGVIADTAVLPDLIGLVDALDEEAREVLSSRPG